MCDVDQIVRVASRRPVLLGREHEVTRAAVICDVDTGRPRASRSAPVQLGTDARILVRRHEHAAVIDHQVAVVDDDRGGEVLLVHRCGVLACHHQQAEGENRGMLTETVSYLVSAARVRAYDVQSLLDALPLEAFAAVQPGDRVVLKPNWVLHSHKYRPDDWDYVITHPVVITAVLRRVLARLDGHGAVVITDAPTTEASFRQLIARYPVGSWQDLARRAGVSLEIIDLRDWEWETRNDITVRRYRLAGDPRGKTEIMLRGEHSEFFGHKTSRRGYHGADYDRIETNRAHDGVRNLYSVSRTVLEADVFINLPKLKTHRKAGITCCLKNLVGINTYKNYLPHHSEGGPSEGGDQFPVDNLNARVEGPLLGFLKQHVLRSATLARTLAPLNTLGRKVFGDTREVVRSGNWYGNDTIWRMILDLNKVLFYGRPDGSLREPDLVHAKRYIGVVDAIRAGEGHGPLAPERVEMGYVIWGTNPVAIDAACATLMGFDPMKIPSIERAPAVRAYPLTAFTLDEVRISLAGHAYALRDVPSAAIVPFEPQFGWKGHIERVQHVDRAAG